MTEIIIRAVSRSRQTESEKLESMSIRNEQCRSRRLAESPDEREAELATCYLLFLNP